MNIKLRPEDEIAARILTDAFIKMWGNDDNFVQEYNPAGYSVIEGNPNVDRRARTITLSH